MRKSTEELDLDDSAFRHAVLFALHALTAASSYDVWQVGQTKIAVGAQLTFHQPDKRLTVLYGDIPVAGQLYLPY